MYKRKLQALNYPDVNSVNISGEKEFYNVILWLEDQKIRHYKIEDREGLRNQKSKERKTAYDKYKRDVGCPIRSGKKTEELEWLLGYAIRLEYAKNSKKYNKKPNTNVPNVVAINPLDNLDFSSPEFLKGINEIAKILKISQHPNHLVTLEAATKIVSKRLNPKAFENPENVIVKGDPYPFEEVDSGFNQKDPLVNKAAKILRLIHIQNLRNLQTSANELIVAVQNVTAYPKTDMRLGKVGNK